MDSVQINSLPKFGILARELWRGKSLPRIFLNYSLKDIQVNGNALDLGSKSSAMSYNRFLKKGEGAKITYTDYRESGDGVLKLNLEEKFDIESGSYQTITCFNTLEHIYNFKNLAEESFRILKPGGTFIGGVPFLVNYHADPHDYFRYTDEAIKKIFLDAGFKKEKIEFLGVGPATAALSISLNIFPKFLRPFVAIKAIWLDRVILKIKKSQRNRYALGYMFIFSKDE